MAEPLSTAISSRITVFSATTKKLHHLIVNMRRVPEEMMALSSEMSDLTVVLLELKGAMTTRKILPKESRKRLASLMSRADSRMEEVEELIGRLTRKHSSYFLSLGRFSWVTGRVKDESLQRELRNLRLDIAALLAANTTTGILRIEACLKQLATVAKRRPNQEIQLNVGALSEDATNGQALNDLLHKVMPIVRKYEQSLQRSIIQSSVLGKSVDEKGGSRLSASDPPPNYSFQDPFNIQVIGDYSEPCLMGCPCACHRRSHLSSWPALNSVMGHLFLGYSSTILAQARCTESSCYQPSKKSLQLIYYFPSWFLNRVLVMVMSQSPFEFVHASISLHKIVQPTADVFEFCAAGDVEGIHALFKAGRASANDSYRAGGSSLLTYAIERGQVQVARFLIDVGADPLIEDGLKRSSVDFACINVFANTFGEVVTKSFRDMLLPPPVLAKKKLTVLHQIVVGLLMRDLSDELPLLVHVIDDQTWDGKTALSWACRRGDINAVNLLLRYGADPSICDMRGNGPLHSAACSTNWRCITALLAHHADATHNNSRNESPLHYSLFYNDDPHYLQPLLEHGADVNCRDYHGDTPLITATYRAPARAPVPALGAVSCVEYLIQHGASMEIANVDGNTPLLNAVIHNNSSALRVLLKNGADQLVRNCAGDNILHLAARHGDLCTLRVLSNAALQLLDIEALNNGGYTPRESIKERNHAIEGFPKAFDQLLLSLAAEAVLASMVSSTVITISSYETLSNTSQI